MRAEEVPCRTSRMGEHLAQAYIQNDILGKAISEKHLKKQRLWGFVIHVVPKVQNTTSGTAHQELCFQHENKSERQAHPYPG